MLVKICGIQSLEIAKVVEENKADLMGFIFADSRRYINPIAAAKISAEIKSVAKVGVFVNEEPARVNEIADFCHLDYVQLHGNETIEYCKKVKYPIIKAFRYKEDFDPKILYQYSVDMILIDTYQAGSAGGTGRCFDWKTAKGKLSKLHLPVFIAGGISKMNVGEMINVLNPAGVDVSGGVESNGIKSKGKIIDFIKQVHELEWRVKNVRCNCRKEKNYC